MAGQVLMVQGTASHVGKSVLVSAFCRIFRQDGFRVAPFKAQNMSNNSYVTADGGEIGRAQAVQADAAGVEARVEMNPVLLKPEADHISQVIVMGRPLLSAKAKDYFALKPQLWEAVRTSLDSLREDFDIVVVEGAGSPAEINLKANEIVNMRVALYANAPVLLCGDIDRGGVFAALVGTLELLEPEEREIVKAFIINKFRGDPSLLTDGITWLEERTGIPVAGLIHYYRDIHIPEEDSVALEDPVESAPQSVLDVAVLQLPHISNFDDFDPLARHPGVNLRYVDSPTQLGRPDLVIIPGTKTTIPDLAWMNERGLSQAVKDLHGGGAAVLGICGGYQMLGTKVSDPDHIESSISELDGLGLLDLTTVFEGSKETHRITGRVIAATGLLAGASGMPVKGYEIHMGRTVGERFTSPFCIEDRADAPVTGNGDLEGAMDASGGVMGTYIHGLFHNGELRGAMLRELARRKGVTLPEVTAEMDQDREYDKLADWVRSSIDMDLVYRVSGLSRDYDAAGD
ncbi:MAG: cobyric acid synthase [Chloroflexi bacterium]|nr:cobyric acid synthase [Chloroflexota bacterium]